MLIEYVFFCAQGGKTTEKYHPESKKQYQSAHQDIERDKHANTASDTGFFESEAEGIFSGDQKDTENTRTKEIEEEKEWEEALSSPEQQGCYQVQLDLEY